MKSKVLKVTGLFLLVFYVFIVFEVDFRGADEPIYYAYTQSLVEDGDLNVVNQDYQKSYQVTVSQTYNLPDFHNHGGIIVWWPFYLYGKVVFETARKLDISQISQYSLEEVTSCSMAFSTVFFTLILWILVYRFCSIFFPWRICLFSIIIMFFGTPLFYYALFENGNANIVATIFSFISIWFCLLAVDFRKIHWFLYGVFFSLMVTVKSELWVQLSFVLPFFFFLIITRRTPLRNIIYFFSGIIPVTLLRLINCYIKYGNLHTEELMYILSALRYKTTYIFNGLFNPFRGIFYTSPLMYFVLAGFVGIIIFLVRRRKGKEDEKLNCLLFFLMGFYAFLKVYWISGIFSPGGDSLSMRVVLSEWPVFVVLLAYFFQRIMKRRAVKYTVYAFSLVFVFWNLLIISEYLCGLDWYYVAGSPPLPLRLQQVQYAFEFIFSSKNLNIKIATCLLLPFLGLITMYYLSGNLRKICKKLFWYQGEKNNHKVIFLFSSFTVYSAVAYLLITGLNIYNNARNVRNLKKEGFFKDANVIKISAWDLTEIEKEHHLRMLFEMRRFYALKGQIEASDYIKQRREEIFGDSECVHSYFSEPLRPYELLIEWYQSNKKYHKVIDSYKKMIDFDPQDIDAYIGLGDFYVKIGEYSQAIKTFKKAIEVKPSSPNVCMRLANLYDRVQKDKKAIEYYEKYLQIRPGSFNAYNNLGNIYLELGNYTKALEYFKKAEKFQYYMNSIDFLNNMATIYTKVGEHDKAIDNLKSILEIDPAFMEAYTNLAHLYNTKGDYSKAIEYYKKAIKINPGFLDAYLSIGDIYDNIAEYENAESYYKKAIKINPGFLDAHLRLGIIYERMGRYESAVESLKKAEEINPESL
ncbi:MAG: tetratricopeptide repeat protein, partial [Candidatus Omnitrophica bacterium]|nr:tetratricopeptide repeat protein [Candidatus Omnitrophota bacterium]MBD3269574.1 tetratricopeptide repeat protein [Candidatus Omnitrophota bacterium]